LQLACRAHTGVEWRDIASIHDRLSARPANTRASVAHHRRDDPDFDHRYTELIDHAHALQQAAGYANVNLNGGLTGRSRTRPERRPGFNFVSNGKVA
jgi:hypothetical protein